MEKAFAKAEELAGTIKEYINTRIEAVKLSAAEKTSAIVANVIARIMVALLFVFFLVLASIALALVLGQWMGAIWAGFLVVAGLYLLACITVWKARNKLIRLPLTKQTI